MDEDPRVTERASCRDAHQATSDDPATGDAVRWLSRPIRTATNSKPPRAKPAQLRIGRAIGALDDVISDVIADVIAGRTGNLGFKNFS